jgi:hypothetical protein
MSRNRIVVQVSYQKDKGYKKGVGYYVKPDGTRKRRVFWLGHDRRVAERTAVMLVALWRKLQEQGRQVWPPGDVLEDARLFAFDGERLRLDRAFAAFAELPSSLMAWDGRSMPKPLPEQP